MFYIVSDVSKSYHIFSTPEIFVLIYRNLTSNKTFTPPSSWYLFL